MFSFLGDSRPKSVPQFFAIFGGTDESPIENPNNIMQRSVTTSARSARGRTATIPSVLEEIDNWKESELNEQTKKDPLRRDQIVDPLRREPLLLKLSLKYDWSTETMSKVELPTVIYGYQPKHDKMIATLFKDYKGDILLLAFEDIDRPYLAIGSLRRDIWRRGERSLEVLSFTLQEQVRPQYPQSMNVRLMKFLGSRVMMKEKTKKMYRLLEKSIRNDITKVIKYKVKEDVGDSPEWLRQSFTEYHGINFETEYPETSEELDSPDNDTTPAGRASYDQINSDSEHMKMYSSTSPGPTIVSYSQEKEISCRRARSTSRGLFTHIEELDSAVAHREEQSDPQEDREEESESESRFAWLGPNEFKELFQVELNTFKEALNAYE